MQSEWVERNYSEFSVACVCARVCVCCRRTVVRMM